MTTATVVFLSALFLAHWLGDFVFQSNWIAANKSKSYMALGLHCVIWMITVLVAAYIGMAVMARGEMPPHDRLVLFGGINLALHLKIDWVTSRINSYLYRSGRIHAFFISLGFDQWMHIVTLLVTAHLLLLGGM